MFILFQDCIFNLTCIEILGRKFCESGKLDFLFNIPNHET